MLKKLIKYDLKSMSRAFIPMWILAPVVSLLLSFSIRGTIAWANSSIPGRQMLTLGNGILTAVMVILFIGAGMGLLIMTVVFVIQRFWNGLLKEEGYLMFTLPVKTWELIVSKAVTATLISSISAVVGVFSAIILAVCSTEEVVRTLAMAWKYFLSYLIHVDPIFWIDLVLFILVLVAGTVKSIYHVYAAMSLGHLFQTHKVAGSCVSYIGISMVVSIITNIIGTVVSLALPDDWTYYWGFTYREGMFGMLSAAYLLYMLVFALLETMVYHVITERILSTKLNLE